MCTKNIYGSPRCPIQLDTHLSTKRWSFYRLLGVSFILPIRCRKKDDGDHVRLPGQQLSNTMLDCSSRRLRVARGLPRGVMVTTIRRWNHSFFVARGIGTYRPHVCSSSHGRDTPLSHLPQVLNLGGCEGCTLSGFSPRKLVGQFLPGPKSGRYGSPAQLPEEVRRNIRRIRVSLRCYHNQIVWVVAIP